MTAEDLKRLRRKLGWSQAEAAKQLGCSTRSIVNWESASAKVPRTVALAASAILMSLPAYGDKISSADH